jgi:hypothetical protein
VDSGLHCEEKKRNTVVGIPGITLPVLRTTFSTRQSLAEFQGGVNSF